MYGEACAKIHRAIDQQEEVANEMTFETIISELCFTNNIEGFSIMFGLNNNNVSVSPQATAIEART